MKLIVSVVLAFMAIEGCFAFYLRQEKILPFGKNVADEGEIEVKLSVTKPGGGDNGFPAEFVVVYQDALGKEDTRVFVREDGLLRNSPKLNNVFTIGASEKVERVEGTDVAMQAYTSADKKASAILFDNSHIVQDQKVSTAEKFSPMITIPTEDGTEVDIMPTVTVFKSRAKNGQLKPVSSRLGLSVRQRSSDEVQIGNDYAEVKDSNVKFEFSSQKKKRAVGGQPVAGYIECVIVADYSAYLKHMADAGTTDQKVALLYIKIFYSHLINAINQRYINTFATDADMKIQVRVTNFVIQTTLAESTWADPVTVGIPGNSTATYNGKQVIVATPTLTAFKNFMEAKTFPFTYDHAFGMLDKDLWADNAAWAAASRTGVAGFAYVGTVCGTSRYSVNEEKGFASIVVLAHELGHNLGAYHDGDASNAQAALCATTDNYIMTPTSGASALNLQNYYKFSPCSVNNFKTNLLDANGPFKAAFACLTNIPVNAELETSYFNASFPGQLFNADDQCKLLYGSTSDSASCSWAVTTTICETIYCLSGGSCWSSKGRGALDGTICGTNQICFNGACVSNSIAVATNFPANPCSPNPCLNGGVCTQAARLYTCNCPAGFTGQTCEISGATTASTASQTSTTLAPGATSQPVTTLAPGATSQPVTTLAPGATSQPITTLAPGATTTTTAPLALPGGGSSGCKIAASITSLIISIMYSLHSANQLSYP